MKNKKPGYIFNRSELPEILTVYQVAMFLNCSESKIRKVINDNRMRSIRDGNIIRIQKQALFDYIEEHGGLMS